MIIVAWSMDRTLSLPNIYDNVLNVKQVFILHIIALCLALALALLG